MVHAEKRHVSTEELELYSLNRLQEPALGRVEEHLLICEQCRKRLEKEDRFSNAARSALKQLKDCGGCIGG